jgi:hypothetical protein
MKVANRWMISQYHILAHDITIHLSIKYSHEEKNRNQDT